MNIIDKKIDIYFFLKMIYCLRFENIFLKFNIFNLNNFFMKKIYLLLFSSSIRSISD